MTKATIFTLLFAAITLATAAQSKLSPDAQIGLVTYDPSESAVFTLYGHSAIRIKDEANKLDKIYNYGIFDFEAPAFLYRFVKGETDYMLGVVDYKHLLFDCKIRECGAREQILNLTYDEKEKIWDYLQWNAQPENAVYRYNFFFDNCATRPAAIIESAISGNILYDSSSGAHTFRELINHCMRNNPWLIFGTELVLGSQADRQATQKEEFFLPLLLEDAFSKAIVKNPDGSERKLVSKTITLIDSYPEKPVPQPLSPLAFALITLSLTILLTIFERSLRRRFIYLDALLFLSAGLAGSLIFFLAFISIHPATWPNCLILWLHPFHLAGAVLVLVKPWQKAAKVYHYINSALLLILLLAMNFLPQTINSAFIPLILTFMFRSILNVFPPQPTIR